MNTRTFKAIFTKPLIVLEPNVLKRVLSEYGFGEYSLSTDGEVLTVEPDLTTNIRDFVLCVARIVGDEVTAVGMIIENNEYEPNFEYGY